tara:strand:- start:2126 stop:2314 length:189 start_codon:yes stop_codon:yes gene_type:complete
MTVKIGQVYTREGRRYQIMQIKSSLVIAHSYGEDHGVDTIIYVNKESGKVIATKARYGRKPK